MPETFVGEAARGGRAGPVTFERADIGKTAFLLINGAPAQEVFDGHLIDSEWVWVYVRGATRATGRLTITCADPSIGFHPTPCQ